MQLVVALPPYRGRSALAKVDRGIADQHLPGEFVDHPGGDGGVGLD